MEFIKKIVGDRFNFKLSQSAAQKNKSAVNPKIIKQFSVSYHQDGLQIALIEKSN